MSGFFLISSEQYIILLKTLDTSIINYVDEISKTAVDNTKSEKGRGRVKPETVARQ